MLRWRLETGPAIRGGGRTDGHTETYDLPLFVALAVPLIDRQPDREWIHHFLAEILLLRGEMAAALAESDQEINEQARIAVLRLILYAAGRQAEADAASKALIESSAPPRAQIGLSCRRRGYRLGIDSIGLSFGATPAANLPAVWSSKSAA